MKYQKFIWLAIALVAIAAIVLAVTLSDAGPAEDTKPPANADTSATSPDGTVSGTVSDTEAETEVETYELYEEVVENVRIQIYSDSVLRVEKAVDGAFCDDKTLAVTNRTDWRGTPVERSEDEDAIYLKTPAYTVCIRKSVSGIGAVDINDPAGVNIWHRRASDLSAVVSLPAPAETPNVWCFSDTPRLTVPENGFTEITEAEHNGFDYQKQVEDFYIFIPNGDAFKLREDYNRLIGACDMVTVKALGLWFSRYHAYTDTELLALVDTFRERGYPIDYIVCDTDWRTGGSTGYNINKTYFPDMEGFLSAMHQKNIHVAFNDHVRDYKDSMLSAVQLRWFNKNLTSLLELGLDTWWYDRNWSYTLNSPFADIPADMLGQLMYLEISRAYFEAQGRRTVLLSNYYADVHSRLTLPAYIGTHRYSIQWTGDITPAVLPRELENMVMLGALTSTGYVSSDIGGHLYAPTDEMFIRWTQYGALSPIMRYHSSGADRSPWTHGAAADSVASRYINLRYRLMPLFYTLAYENYALGLPLARRLDFYYPQHEEARANDQYLLGEDILVAPITEGDRAPDPAWLTSPDGTPGVEISYFGGQDPTGTPLATEKTPTVDFFWGTDAPTVGVPADNFSALLRTSMTVGDYDVHLGTLSDDGVRVYVDGRLVIDFWQASDSTVQVNKDVVLKAHTTYSIRIEYYEGSGDALLRLLCIPATLSDKVTASRDVFIPDGRWMDVFSGKIYEGPATVTVTHGISSSPVFVRLGSLSVLALKSDHADTAEWERLVLDVYPTEGTSDTSTLYEDDGTTLAYRSGGYRKTALTMTTKEGRTTLKIGAAKGGYTTEWTEREWTVRIHSAGLNDIKTVKVDGKSVGFIRLSADKYADPFAAEGGSPDGDVILVTVTVPVGRACEIVIE